MFIFISCTNLLLFSTHTPSRRTISSSTRLLSFISLADALCNKKKKKHRYICFPKTNQANLLSPRLLLDIEMILPPLLILLLLLLLSQRTSDIKAKRMKYVRVRGEKNRETEGAIVGQGQPQCTFHQDLVNLSGGAMLLASR